VRVRGRLRLASAVALLAAASVADATACRDNAICIDEMQRGSTLEFRARNLSDFPITYTLKVDADVGDAPSTITKTLAAKEVATAIRLQHDGEPGAQYDLSFEWAIGDFEANHDDDYVYAFPYAPGRSYRILQGYGAQFSHRGLEEFAIDFDMAEGTAVHAAREGIVARVEESHDRGCWSDGCGDYANYIVILHSDGTTGEYYHLKRDGALVEVGQRVERGQKIGLSGNTGHTALPHLHFAVYRPSTWGNTQSIPIRFQSADGVISRPRNGGVHQAAH
jgi:murein DD-endopeptidase MepM/ murein hydrolase activator NlpD